MNCAIIKTLDYIVITTIEANEFIGKFVMSIFGTGSLKMYCTYEVPLTIFIHIRYESNKSSSLILYSEIDF